MRGVSSHVLPAEACPEFIDQSRLEGIGVAEREDVAGEVDWIFGAIAGLLPRERGSGPWNAVVPVGHRTIKPLSEKAALIAHLMVNLQGGF